MSEGNKMNTFLFEEHHSATQSRTVLMPALRPKPHHKRWVAVLIAGLVLALLLAPWIQTSRGQGRVIAYQADERVQKIEATTDGRVLKWHAQEGQRVRAGDLIVALTDNDPEIVSRLRAERAAIVARLNQSRQTAKISAVNVERQRALYEGGLSSKRTFELSQIELAKNEVDAANAKAELTRVDVRLSRQEAQEVRAPKDGTLIRVHAGQGGELVKAGELLATFMPDSKERIVEAWVDGNDAPLIRLGTHARLQFEGWPALQISGWPALAIGSFGGEVFYVDSVDNGAGQYRVLVREERDQPWPTTQYLRQGGRVTTWVQMNRVPLGVELWRQFNGFPNGTLAMDSEPSVKKAQAKK